MTDAGTRERARTYHRRQLLLGALRLGITIAYLVAWLVSGAARDLRDAVTALSPVWWVQVPLAVLVLAAGHRLVGMPLAWLGGFWLPRRYGLLHQSLSRWLWDSAKGAGIGAVLGVLAALVVYGLLRWTTWWWLWSAAVFLGGYTMLAVVAPIWLVPLFYRLTPLHDTALAERLLRLAERASVPAVGVWVADQSRKSRTANAAVVGLGATRRILLFDTLLEQFTPDEVEAVLAHELAHQVHGDVRRGLLVQSGLTLCTFWVADHALRLGALALGLAGPADLAALPVFALALVGTGLVALPVGNGWSRHVERQADDFALRTIEDPAAFIRAMKRLAELNLAESDPHPVKEFFLYSHPSIERRIARARALTRSPA